MARRGKDLLPSTTRAPDATSASASAASAGVRPPLAATTECSPYASGDDADAIAVGRAWTRATRAARLGDREETPRAGNEEQRRDAAQRRDAVGATRAEL